MHELDQLYGRNTVWGIGQRTLKNFEFIASAHTMGADVHIVTALITSLLGLIVFPFEEIKERKFTDFKSYKLKDLEKAGWPKWNIELEPTCDNLDRLVFHLRNAASHRRIIFDSDSRQLSHVHLTLTDRPKPHLPDNWRATINAAELRDFVLLFARFLRQWQHDYS
jgi:hypothetical protein